MTSAKNNLRPVVFFDRDGTLNVEAGYIRNLSDLNLIEGAAKAVARLNALNVAAVLASNQSGAARSYYDQEHIANLNKRLVQLLEEEGAHLDGLYFCPHLEEGNFAPLAIVCNCRKPKTGMLDLAFQELPGLDRQKAYVVGDKATDIELAQNAQAKGVLVLTGYGKDVQEGRYQWPCRPDYTCATVSQAVDWILQDLHLL